MLSPLLGRDSALVPVPGGPTQTYKGVTGFRWGTPAPLPRRLGISHRIMSYHIIYHIVSSIISYYLSYRIPYHGLSLHRLCCEWVLRNRARQDPVPNLLCSELHSPSLASSQLPGSQLPSGHRTVPAGALQEEGGGGSGSGAAEGHWFLGQSAAGGS